MSSFEHMFIKKMEELIPTLSVKEFGDYLADHFGKDIAASFEKNKISGSLFLKLKEAQIGKMVEAIGDIVELQELQSKVQVIVLNKVYIVWSPLGTHKTG